MARQHRDSEFIYGLNPVSEALRGRRQHRRLLVRKERRDERRVVETVQSATQVGVSVQEVDQRTLDNLCAGGNHQGVALETGAFPYADLQEILDCANGRPILVLDRIQDPQNLATLVRTAAAVNVAGIVIQTDRSAAVTPAVVRSSAGLVEQVLVARENNTRRTVDTLKENGYWAVALELTETAELIYSADIPEPVALVIGSEERGIAANVLKACDLIVALPMPGRVESLNAAVAGSVALFELLRRTGTRNGGKPREN